jgi:hypothetical protein
MESQISASDEVPLTRWARAIEGVEHQLAFHADEVENTMPVRFAATLELKASTFAAWLGWLPGASRPPYAGVFW